MFTKSYESIRASANTLEFLLFKTGKKNFFPWLLGTIQSAKRRLSLDSRPNLIKSIFFTVKHTKKH